MTIFYNGTSIVQSDNTISLFLNNLEYGLSTSYCKAYVINLDSSTDRWESASQQLTAADIEFTRFSAVNGYTTLMRNLNTDEEVLGIDLKQNNLKTQANTTYEVFYLTTDKNCIIRDNFNTKHYKVPDCTKHDVKISSFKYFGVPMSAGEVGVWASNIEIWKKTIADNCKDKIIVFEDDIKIHDTKHFSNQLEDFISHLPTDFDVAFIDYDQISGFRIRIPDNDLVSAVSENFMAYGLWAVIYSRAGIEKLLNNFEFYKNQIDVFMFQQASYRDPNGLKVYLSEKNLVSISGIDSTIEEMGRGSGYYYYYDDVEV